MSECEDLFGDRALLAVSKLLLLALGVMWVLSMMLMADDGVCFLSWDRRVSVVDWADGVVVLVGFKLTAWLEIGAPFEFGIVGVLMMVVLVLMVWLDELLLGL